VEDIETGATPERRGRVIPLYDFLADFKFLLILKPDWHIDPLNYRILG
jgi:hypothetical protein